MKLAYNYFVFIEQVGLAVVNGQLMAIGGFDGTTYLKTIEVYDPETNSWKLWVCLCVTKVCLYSSYNLNGNSLNLCFLAYYHMENHISIQNFDGTIFLLEDIALFEL
jgi:hypothetical protein